MPCSVRLRAFTKAQCACHSTSKRVATEDGCGCHSLFCFARETGVTYFPATFALVSPALQGVDRLQNKAAAAAAVVIYVLPILHCASAGLHRSTASFLFVCIFTLFALNSG